MNLGVSPLFAGELEGSAGKAKFLVLNFFPFSLRFADKARKTRAGCSDSISPLRPQVDTFSSDPLVVGAGIALPLHPLHVMEAKRRGNLVSHYSAIGDTISCDAPYSAIGCRGKLSLRYPLFGLSLDCDRPLLRKEVGV